MKRLQSPSRLQALRELGTGTVIPQLAVGWPKLARQRRGSGEPVMVLPGFGAGDQSTWMLRTYLRYLQYDVRGWDLGINRGNVEALLPQITQRVVDYAESAGQSVRLLGWSLGGYLAREVARDQPAAVARVVTLGSPVVGGPKYTQVARYYQRMGFDLDVIEALVEERYSSPLTVPVTAIYSRGDGVVAWQACVDTRSPYVEHVEVSGSHLSLGFSPEVLHIVADRMQR